MNHAWLGIVVVLGLAPQDDPAALREEAAKAMLLTAGSGGFALSGESTTEVGEEDPDDEATYCSLAGTVGTPFQAALSIRSGKCTHEIYRKGGKLAGRTLWRGNGFELGNAASELLSLLDFAKLAGAVDTATSPAAGKDEKVGDVDCRPISLKLPKEAVRSYLEDEEAAQEEHASVDHVEIRIWIGKAKGLVHRVRATVHRVYADEENPADSYKAKTSYDFTLKSHGSARVAIPAEIQKQLDE